MLTMTYVFVLRLLDKETGDGFYFLAGVEMLFTALLISEYLNR